MESTITKAEVEAIAATLDASAREYAHARVTRDDDEGAQEFACAYLEGSNRIRQGGEPHNAATTKSGAPTISLKGRLGRAGQAAKALKVEVSQKGSGRVCLTTTKAQRASVSRSYKIEVSSDRDANVNSSNRALWTGEGIGEAEGWDLEEREERLAALTFDGGRLRALSTRARGKTVASQKRVIRHQDAHPSAG